MRSRSFLDRILFQGRPLLLVGVCIRPVEQRLAVNLGVRQDGLLHVVSKQINDPVFLIAHIAYEQYLLNTSGKSLR